MNIFQCVNLLHMIYSPSRAIDLKRIQNYGLLAVKIGQMHALRADFLPTEKCLELTKLYRANTIIPAEDVLTKIDTSLFSYIQTVPLATASVGQVYIAKLHSQKNVVIKVIKGDFKQKFLADVRAMRFLFKIVTTIYPALSRVFDPVKILEHIEEYTLRELNLYHEVEGHTTLYDLYRKHSKDLPRLQFPIMYPKISTENMLISEHISGKSFDELLSNHTLKYQEVLDLFYIHGYYLFKLGVFHGDLHPGNVILYNNKIYLIDTGYIVYSPEKMRTGLLEFFDYLSQYDYSKAAKALYGMSDSTLSQKQYEAYVTKFLELYADFKGKTVSQVSLTTKMMQTIKLGVESGMKFDAAMFPIIKSFMFLDGIVLRCNPNALILQDMRKLIRAFR